MTKIVGMNCRIRILGFESWQWLKDKVFVLKEFTAYSLNKDRSFTMYNTKLNEISLVTLTERIEDDKYKENDIWV